MVKRTVALLDFPGVPLYFILLFAVVYGKLMIVLFGNVLTRFEVMIWKRRVDFISRK